MRIWKVEGIGGGVISLALMASLLGSLLAQQQELAAAQQQERAGTQQQERAAAQQQQERAAPQ